MSEGREIPTPILASDVNRAAVLAAWSNTLPASCDLLGASLLGDLFLADPSGKILMLDLVAGELRSVADCIEEFEWNLTQSQWRKEHLMQDLAEAAFSAGVKPGYGECLAFRTPPMLGGALNVDNLVPWNLLAYHSGLAKLWAQIKGATPENRDLD